MFGLFSSNKAYENLSCQEFRKEIETRADAVIIDVRTKGEFDSGHYKGARNLDILQGDFKKKISGLDKNKHYYVYCRSGARSANAAAIMHSMGFQHISNLRGGMC